MPKRRILPFAAILMGLALTGCAEDGTGKIGQQFQDAPVESRNDNSAIMGTMPDGFSNFASKCDGPNRVYVVFKGDELYAAIAVVPDDPRCTSTPTE